MSDCAYSEFHDRCTNGQACICGYRESSAPPLNLEKWVAWKSKFKSGEIVEIKGVKFSVAHINKRGLTVRKIKL